MLLSPLYSLDFCCFTILVCDVSVLIEVMYTHGVLNNTSIQLYWNIIMGIYVAERSATLHLNNTEDYFRLL